MSGPSSRTVADRQTSIQLQTSAYGGVISVVYGTNRVGGNLVWFGNFQSSAHTTKTGGKGMGGSATNTTFTYTAAAIVALAEGTISGVGKVWKDKERTSLAGLGLTLFTGAPDQPVWSFLSGYATPTNFDYDAQFGYGVGTSYVDQALNYSGTAYVASSAYSLGDSATIPNHTFELRGKNIITLEGDANPADILPDILTAPQYGLGFSSSRIGDLDDFYTYCRAVGIFLSPAYTQARAGSDVIQELCDTTNCGPVWSGGKLKVIPYGDATVTGNGATYTPNLSPLFDLADDDFLETGGNPVKVTRSTPADAYNRISIQYRDRTNDYNQAVVSVEDQDSIEKYGLKIAPTVTADFICEASVAKQVAQLYLQRQLYKRNTYEFSIGARFAMLEPMDIVTLTDPGLGMVRLAVRITEIDETEDGFDVKAEDLLVGVASAATYTHDNGLHWNGSTALVPESCAAPVIFELPGETSTTGLALAIAAGGQPDDPLYGGCNVWISLDGTNYRQEATIIGSSRYGTLTAAMATGDPGVNPANTMAVSLRSGGQMISGSLEDVETGTTLILVGDEYVAYQNATLTGTNAYTLSSLNRGLHGTTPSTHASGAPWVRVDSAIGRMLDVDASLIGQTIFVKLTAFNVYRSAEEDLSSVAAYTYVVTGSMYSVQSDVVIGYLTNESATLPAESDGTVADFTDANGEFRVFFGNDLVTTGVDYSVLSSSGLTINIDTSGAYTITGMTAGVNGASAILRAVYGGVTIDKQYTLAKAVGGQAAKFIRAKAELRTIKYDGVGAPSPTTQTNTITAELINLTGTVSWAIEDANGVNRTPVSSFLSAATSDVVTMTEAQFESARNGTSGVVLIPSVTEGTGPSAVTYTDTIEIKRLQDGFPAKQLKVESNRQQITYNSSGSISPSTQTTTFTVYRQNISSSLTISWSITDLSLNPQSSALLATTTGTSNSITAANFDSARNGTNGIIITATVVDGASTFTSSVTLVKTQDGALGLNNATVYLYQRGATAPAAPSGTFSYAFLTGVLSGGTPNGWTQTIPAADGNPLWVIGAVASASTSSDFIAATEFTSPVQHQGAGLNSTMIVLYQRSATAPAVPATSLTYTFATNVLSGTLGSWSRSVPSGSLPLWTTQALALGTGSSDTIATGEWASPTVMAQDGATGAAGTNSATVYLFQRAATSPAAPSGTFTYTFATGALSGGTLNGWSQAIPAANGNPLWIIAAVATANTATDTIAATEFSTPVIQSGSGLNQATLYLYQRASSAPTVPASSLTYTFSSNTLTGSLGAWTRTVPSGTLPLYVITAVAIGSDATDTITSGEWSSPTVLAQNGADGTNGTNGTNGTDGSTTAVVRLFRRSASSPAATMPSGSFTYTFATNALTGGTTLNGWSTSEPAADGNPLWVTSAIANAIGSSATVLGSAFATPVLLTGAGVNQAEVTLYQRSATTPAVPAGTMTYVFSTGGLSGSPGSWTATVPAANGNPLWVTRAVALSTTSTDTIDTTEWSAPTIFAQDGLPGADALDISATAPNISLPMDASGAITSYANATGSIVVRTNAGTDISSNFTLSTSSNPQALTVSYTGQTYTITGGFDAGEASASLTILITGSGAYSGYIYRRTITLGKVAFNTNVSNDRNSAAVVAPTVSNVGGALSNAINADSSANITFTWSWGGTEVDIDGFEIIVVARTANTEYVSVGGTPAIEQVFTVPPDKRVFTLYGQPSNLFHTFFVRAYRVVDTDINVSGFLRSAAVKTTFAGQNPYQPAATPNYTANIGGTGATSVASVVTNFNTRNDRVSTAIPAPVIATDGTAIDHTANQGGATVDISFEWTWAGVNASIDGFEILYVARTSSTAYTVGTTPSIEQVIRLPSDRRVHYLYGVSPTLYYSFFVRAYRVVDPDVNSARVIYSSWVNSTVTGPPAENPYQPAANAAFDGNITGTVNGVNAAVVSTVATNFNTRNDRNSAAVVAPAIVTDGTAVDHTMNTDGSADISLEWTWTGTNSDIDYWQVMVLGRSSATAYTVGTTPAIEQHYFVPPDRRAFILTGVAANLYWTFAVRAVRIVDPDVNAAGLIASAWVQPSAAATGGSENPYRPSSTVPFLGDISGTVGYAPLPSLPNYDIDIYRRWGTTSLFSRTTVIKLARYKAGTDVSASSTWAVAETYLVSSSSVSSTGLVSIVAQSSADGYIVVTSTYEGITIRHVVSLNTVMGPPIPTAGRTIFAAPFFGSDGITATTEVDISDIFPMRTGSTGSLRARYASAFSKLNSESGNVNNFSGSILLYRRPIAGSFTQVDNFSFNSSALIRNDGPTYSLSFRDFAMTGLSANTDYEFKLTALKSASTAANGAIVGKGLFFEAY